MGAALNNFDANTVPEFEVLPKSEYLVAVVESEMKHPKSGGNPYLSLKMQVLDGPYKNSYVWDSIYLNSKSEKGHAFAQRHLASLCRATGIMTPKNSSELHGKPIVASVYIDSQDGFPDKNRVSSYRATKTPMASVQPVAQAAVPAANNAQEITTDDIPW